MQTIFEPSVISGEQAPSIHTASQRQLQWQPHPLHGKWTHVCSFGGYMRWRNPPDLFFWLAVLCAIGTRPREAQEALRFPLKLPELSQQVLRRQDREKRTILRTLGSACQVSPLRWVYTSLPFWLLMTCLPLFCISYSCLKWIKNTIELKAFLTVSCNISHTSAKDQELFELRHGVSFSLCLHSPRKILLHTRCLMYTLFLWFIFMLPVEMFCLHVCLYIYTSIQSLWSSEQGVRFPGTRCEHRQFQATT